MKSSTIAILGKIFSDYPFMVGAPASKEEVARAEADLNVTFTEDYREFLARFGGATVGACPIYGLSYVETLDNSLWSVVTVTKHFRNQNWPGTDSWYVVSTDLSGNPVGVDNLGKVLTFDHDTGELITLASDFESWLLACAG